MKEFFKITKGKIILAIFLLIFSIWIILPYPFCFDDCPKWFWSSELFLDLIFMPFVYIFKSNIGASQEGYSGSHWSLVDLPDLALLIIQTFYTYLLSCIIFYLYNKIKVKHER